MKEHQSTGIENSTANHSQWLQQQETMKYRLLINSRVVYTGTLNECRRLQPERGWLIQVEASDWKGAWIDYDWF